MEFRVLGDLEVQHDQRAIPLGAHQQRALLGILVVNAGEVVTADRLIDGIWGDVPPARAAKTVQVYVSRLRKALAAAAGPAADDVIVTRDHGYALRVDPGQIDAAVFERLLAEGRRGFADGAYALAAERLNEALALWRGAALSDFTFDLWAAEEIARLEELRLEALEARIDAELELGRHAALVAELEALIARHPLREHLRSQLMLALYRGGRQSDALAVFHETRRVLVDELGVEPGPALRARHEAICARTLPSTRPPRSSRQPSSGIASAAYHGGPPWPASACSPLPLPSPPWSGRSCSTAAEPRPPSRPTRSP